MRPRTSIDPGDQDTIREIVDMERQAREASLRRDAEFSQRTLADDYVAITPLGQVTTKQDTVSARKSGQLRYDTIDVSDMVVRLYGDTAVVTARADVKGHQLGEDFSGPYRYTRVWVRNRPLASRQLPSHRHSVGSRLSGQGSPAVATMKPRSEGYLDAIIRKV
jgi:ketosteroid isomerase-like protein